MNEITPEERIKNYIEKHKKGKIYTIDILVALGITIEKIEEILKELYPSNFVPSVGSYLDFHD